MDWLKDMQERAKRAKRAGVCLQCDRPALERCYSDAGRREYRISGYCEPCYDRLFDPAPEPSCPSCGGAHTPYC